MLVRKKISGTILSNIIPAIVLFVFRLVCFSSLKTNNTEVFTGNASIKLPSPSSKQFVILDFGYVRNSLNKYYEILNLVKANQNIPDEAGVTKKHGLLYNVYALYNAKDKKPIFTDNNAIEDISGNSMRNLYLGENVNVTLLYFPRTGKSNLIPRTRNRKPFNVTDKINESTHISTVMFDKNNETKTIDIGKIVTESLNRIKRELVEHCGCSGNFTKATKKCLIVTDKLMPLKPCEEEKTDEILHDRNMNRGKSKVLLSEKKTIFRRSLAKHEENNVTNTYHNDQTSKSRLNIDSHLKPIYGESWHNTPLDHFTYLHRVSPGAYRFDDIPWSFLAAASENSIKIFHNASRTGTLFLVPRCSIFDVSSLFARRPKSLSGLALVDPGQIPFDYHKQEIKPDSITRNSYRYDSHHFERRRVRRQIKEKRNSVMDREPRHLSPCKHKKRNDKRETIAKANGDQTKRISAKIKKNSSVMLPPCNVDIPYYQNTWQNYRAASSKSSEKELYLKRKLRFTSILKGLKKSSPTYKRNDTRSNLEKRKELKPLAYLRSVDKILERLKRTTYGSDAGVDVHSNQGIAQGLSQQFKLQSFKSRLNMPQNIPGNLPANVPNSVPVNEQMNQPSLNPVKEDQQRNLFVIKSNLHSVLLTHLWNELVNFDRCFWAAQRLFCNTNGFNANAAHMSGFSGIVELNSNARSRARSGRTMFTKHKDADFIWNNCKRFAVEEYVNYENQHDFSHSFTGFAVNSTILPFYSSLSNSLQWMYVRLSTTQGDTIANAFRVSRDERRIDSIRRANEQKSKKLTIDKAMTVDDSTKQQSIQQLEQTWLNSESEFEFSGTRFLEISDGDVTRYDEYQFLLNSILAKSIEIARLRKQIMEANRQRHGQLQSSKYRSRR